ncbi:MAG: HAD family phosphatase [Sedimentisphaerales bacterium]|nr:HAD family phosphatase [Sedimentisphaerales bacterium]
MKLKQEENHWAVIFDVDGTMVDNYRFHQAAWIELGRRHNLPVTPEYYKANIHARSNDKNVTALLGNKATPEWIHKLGEEKEAIYRELFGPHLREIPGLNALLNELNEADIPCGAASNSPKANVDFVLDGLGIRCYFQAITTRCDVTIGKPDPQLFTITADKLGVPVQQCIIMEDSASGFLAARNANALYVVISAGADPDDLPLAISASLMVRNFTELSLDRLIRCFPQIS